LQLAVVKQAEIFQQ